MCARHKPLNVFDLSVGYYQCGGKMPLFFIIRLPVVTAVFFGSLLFFRTASAEMDPRFELDPQALPGVKSPAATHFTSKKRHTRVPAEQSTVTTDKGSLYTVKPGDQMYKILIRDFGLTRNEAWQFMEEIKRENNISDIEFIKAGNRITIPPIRRRPDGSLITSHSASAANAKSSSDAAGAEQAQAFKLESPVGAISEQEAITGVQNAWSRLVPSTKVQQKPLTLQTSTFSLTLDPERYPMFARMDGGRIVLDPNGSIPPLVKSLIEDKDATVRIVTEAPAGSKRFMASLLEAAGFYSVEENVSMEFGVDPKLTVQADFEVEKTPESLIKQDIVLINSGRTALPPILGEFLKKEGFSLYEPFASQKSFAQRDSRTIFPVSAKKQPETIDSILTAFSVAPERDRRVDLFSTENNGISLSVKAERYFERGGQRYVVTRFDGDPINYTLFRILETKGYRVVIIEAQDDFRRISEKLIARMKIKGGFAQHNLLQDGAAGYSLQMSGFKLDDTLLPGGGIFLTDRSMDRIVRDLFIENGFTINGR
jgi:hypothetical protein